MPPLDILFITSLKVPHKITWNGLGFLRHTAMSTLPVVAGMFPAIAGTVHMPKLILYKLQQAKIPLWIATCINSSLILQIWRSWYH